MAIIPTDKVINVVQAIIEFVQYLGPYIKANLEKIENKISEINSLSPSSSKYCSEKAVRDYLPIGCIIGLSSSVTVPNGWLLCDGSTVDSSLYPSLYTIITTTPDLSTHVSGLKYIIKAL